MTRPIYWRFKRFPLHTEWGLRHPRWAVVANLAWTVISSAVIALAIVAGAQIAINAISWAWASGRVG